MRHSPSVGEPGYLPYCGRCPGLIRMVRRVTRFGCPRCLLESRIINGEDMFDRTAPLTKVEIEGSREQIVKLCLLLVEGAGDDREHPLYHLAAMIEDQLEPVNDHDTGPIHCDDLILWKLDTGEKYS